MKVIKTVFCSIGKFFRTINKHNWQYKIVALLGVLFRVIALPFIIPDFFELIFPFLITASIPAWLYHILLRLFLIAIDFLGLSSIFHWLSFGTTGLCYTRQYKYRSGSRTESKSAIGSAFYTTYYTIYTAIPVLLFLWFYWWVILIITVVYIGISFGFYCIASYVKVLPDNWIANMIAHAILTLVVFTTLFTGSFFC